MPTEGGAGDVARELERKERAQFYTLIDKEQEEARLIAKITKAIKTSEKQGP